MFAYITYLDHIYTFQIIFNIASKLCKHKYSFLSGLIADYKRRLYVHCAILIVLRTIISPEHA